MNKKIVFVILIVLFSTLDLFSQNLEIINLKSLHTATTGGGGTSIYCFLKDFNQKSTNDWVRIKETILKVFANNTKVNQLTIYFLNKPIYDFTSYKKNYFDHPVPDIQDLYAFTVGNKRNPDSESRCSSTITLDLIEPMIGYLSNICYPSK